MNMYDDIVYARSRLLETVVMYQDIPVVVDDIQGDNAYLRRLGEGEPIFASVKDLNINPVKLGYLNDGHRALYLTRTPMREDWRQGLRSRSIRAIGYDGLHYEPAPVSLKHTILGIYPMLSECISFVKIGIMESMAFSRNFAVKGDNILTYKGKWDVGTITDTKDYTLSPKFDWVRETLDEELVAA